MFYQIIIKPIEILLEVIFVIAYRLLDNPGIAIIIVSIVMNIIILPLSHRAEAIQEHERSKQEKMSRWTNHIRATFRGDERFMMLSAYYREVHYRPIYAIKASLPLVLQLPFFIAAYQFLSNLQLLAGKGFFVIPDLSKPYVLALVSGLPLHLLPIVMTAINIVSSTIYCKGKPVKEKVQLYVTAIVFLLLLYNAPSGLVLYWTCNNLVSLFRNIRGDRITLKETRAEKEKEDTVFFFCMLFFTVLLGCMIPSELIQASPPEFIDIQNYHNPLVYVLFTGGLAAGVFLLWGDLFYILSNKKTRKVLTIIAWGLAGVFLMDYLFFGRGLGTISPDLQFSIYPIFSPREYICNTLAIIVVFLLFSFLLKKAGRWVPHILVILIIGAVGVSLYNFKKVNHYLSANPDMEKVKTYDAEAIEPITFINKGSKNVLVIMLDRAISGFVPYIFHETEELEKRFAGFTYYPNTISFGGGTNLGAPGLYGGYEYIPEIADLGNDRVLGEAEYMLPVLFANEGFQSTTVDPPLDYFREDLSLPEITGIDNVRIHETYGVYRDEFTAEHAETFDMLRRRNMFFYSMLKVSPVVLQRAVYDDANYYVADVLPHIHVDFRSNYPVLKHLNKLITVGEDNRNTFTIITNVTTHGPSVLQLPDYEPSYTVDNTIYSMQRVNAAGDVLSIEDTDRFEHYCVNVAALKELADFFDYMRENEVYDDTRIIIVSDHGYPLGLFPEIKVDDVSKYNALLMVKDFGASDPFTMSHEFRTVADVPYLATNQLLEAKNPFTGELLKPGNSSEPWEIQGSSDILLVKDNIFESSNWKKAGEAEGDQR